MASLKQRAAELRQRAEDLRKAGTMAQMTKGPALVEDVGSFLVDLAARVDDLTPYIDEGAA